MSTSEQPQVLASSRPPARRIHPAWWVAVVAMVAIIGAAAFRSVPGALMQPLHDEFGWSHGTIGFAISINLLLFGLTAPFSAALMERLGINKVAAGALLLIAAGSILPLWISHSWQLVLTWGVLVGLGSGAMSMAVVSTIVGRWFIKRQGLVSGILTAASATGQLIFLPLVAVVSAHAGWRSAAAITALVALAVTPLVWWKLRPYPGTIGVTPYGAPADQPVQLPPPPRVGAAALALRTLADAAHSRVFWVLVATFAICGASTNGLIQTHFIPAAHDHGMTEPVAAGLLAFIGIFDVVGTIFSGWLTDRVNAGVLLAVYYLLRGLSLLVLPILFAPSVHPSLLFFIIFYGLDWVATVPPTMALSRQHFGDRAAIVFGWIFAAHQLGAAVAASGAGWIRDHFGEYTHAWQIAAGLCVIASAMCLTVIRGSRHRQPAVPVPVGS